MTTDEEAARERRGLQDLLSRQEIYDVLVRYCRGADRRDNSLILSAFHEDAVDNHSGVSVPVMERMAESDANSESSVISSTHTMGNVLIELDADIANVESRFIACIRCEHGEGEVDWLMGGRYVDRFERRGGVWRIADRTVVYDWSRVDVVDPLSAGFTAVRYLDQAERGARTRSDYSYRLLKGR